MKRKLINLLFVITANYLMLWSSLFFGREALLNDYIIELILYCLQVFRVQYSRVDIWTCQNLIWHVLFKVNLNFVLLRFFLKCWSYLKDINFLNNVNQQLRFTTKVVNRSIVPFFVPISFIAYVYLKPN